MRTRKVVNGVPYIGTKLAEGLSVVVSIRTIHEGLDWGLRLVPEVYDVWDVDPSNDPVRKVGTPSEVDAFLQLCFTETEPNGHL